MLASRNLPVVISAIMLSSLFLLSYYYSNKNDPVVWNEQQNQVLVQVKETTVKADGDRLTFEGLYRQREKTETVLVRYTFSSEEEKTIMMSEKKDTYLVIGAAVEPGEASNFNQFDYKQYLNRKKIVTIIEAEELIPYHPVDLNKTIEYQVDSLRQRVLSYIDRSFSVPSAVYIKALLFADKREFPEPVSRSFRELGIVHLLSISGLHIHFLIDGFKKLLIKLSVTKETSRWILILSLPVYGMMAGFGVSVFRAVGQAWIKLFGEITDMRLSVLDSWSLVLCLVLFFDPYVVFNVGFQLSYLISLIIILLTEQPYFKTYSGIKAYSVMSVIVFLSSLPVLSYHFFEFSWGVILLNSLYIPFMSFLVLPSLVMVFSLSVFLSGTPLFSSLLGLTDWIILEMERLTAYLNEVASFSVITGRLSKVAIACFILAFVCLMVVLEKKKNKGKWLVLSLLVMLLSTFSVRYSPFGQVMMIDVGQGESILIKEPWGKGAFLIDTGGLVNWQKKEQWQERAEPFSVGQDVVVPVLKSQGVHHLKTLIITHSDWDHFGGMEDILQSIPTDTVFTTSRTFQDDGVQESLRLSLSKETKLMTPHADSSLYLPTHFRVLDPYDTNHPSTNNHSLILLGLAGDYTWLFTGDLEEEGERELIRMYPNLKTDVLKVGHHGSDTSTHEDLLGQLNATYAWISAGKNNPYGHPHPFVLERLERNGTMVFRTDKQGSILYTYTNNNVLKQWIKRDTPFSTYKK